MNSYSWKLVVLLLTLVILPRVRKLGWSGLLSTEPGTKTRQGQVSIIHKIELGVFGFNLPESGLNSEKKIVILDLLKSTPS